jgi:hypothetical protein
MKRIWKLITVCEYFRRSAQVVISRMRAVFPIHWQATDANTRKADNVYVLFFVFKMFKMIEPLADCEIGLLSIFECKKCETG